MKIKSNSSQFKNAFSTSFGSTLLTMVLSRSLKVWNLTFNYSISSSKYSIDYTVWFKYSSISSKMFCNTLWCVSRIFFCLFPFIVSKKNIIKKNWPNFEVETKEKCLHMVRCNLFSNRKFLNCDAQKIFRNSHLNSNLVSLIYSLWRNLV